MIIFFFLSKSSEDHCNIQRFETDKSPNAHFQLVILLCLPELKLLELFKTYLCRNGLGFS